VYIEDLYTEMSTALDLDIPINARIALGQRFNVELAFVKGRDPHNGPYFYKIKRRSCK
jgi:hypothetical protein